MNPIIPYPNPINSAGQGSVLNEYAAPRIDGPPNRAIGFRIRFAFSMKSGGGVRLEYSGRVFTTGRQMKQTMH
jgi:hypothetical protein